MSKRTYSLNAYESSIASGISAAATEIQLTSAAGLRAPGYLVLEPDSVTKREYFKFTGISTNTLTGCTRGLTGSAAGAEPHDAGAVVRAVAMHQWLDDIYDDIEDLEAFETAHAGATTTTAHPEATTSTRGFLSAADKTKLDGIESGAEVNPSASELLTSIKTVDGSGSGLDADTLDGIQASAFALVSHTHDPDYYIQPSGGAATFTPNGSWQIIHTMTSAPRDGVIIFFAQSMFGSSGATATSAVEISAGVTAGQYKMREVMDPSADDASLTIVGIIAVTQGTAIRVWARTIDTNIGTILYADLSCGYAYLDGAVDVGST